MKEHYSLIDKSPLVNFLFYPRKDFIRGPGNSFDSEIMVQEGVSISCRYFHCDDLKLPWIIYFHGNGEVVSDYNEIAPMYNREKINIAVVDYRGYGKSTGSPSFNGMFADACSVFESVEKELAGKGYKDKLFVMGRSLGSLSAMELAGLFPERLKGLIIESGFISPSRLLSHLGLPSFGLNLKPLEEDAMSKAGDITLPALIIHGERDSLVPLREGEDLYKTIGSKQKELVIIPRADHNDIMFVGQKQYFSAIVDFIYKTAQ